MKKFDLEAARRGAAVCTTDGRDVVLVAISSATQTICGYVAANKLHDLWDLQGAHSFAEDRCLMMRDDDYVERLERGEYQPIDDGFARETPKTNEPKAEQPDAEQKTADKAIPNEEKTYAFSTSSPDSVAYGALLGALFGSPFTSATRLRINIEYDGNPVRFDIDKALTYLQSTRPSPSAPTPSPKQEA